MMLGYRMSQVHYDVCVLKLSIWNSKVVWRQQNKSYIVILLFSYTSLLMDHKQNIVISWQCMFCLSVPLSYVFYFSQRFKFNIWKGTGRFCEVVNPWVRFALGLKLCYISRIFKNCLASLWLFILNILQTEYYTISFSKHVAMVFESVKCKDIVFNIQL